jgi:hypothetical protein
MCLKSLIPIQQTSGYGIKRVRRLTKDTFTSYYQVFSPEGKGGTHTVDISRYAKAGYHISRVVYKIGRTYRVKHNHVAFASARYWENQHTEYPALVHCWHDMRSARQRKPSLADEDTCYILVKYSGGQYTDGSTFTAKYITPIASLTQNQARTFRILEEEIGFEATVKAFLDAQIWMEEK